MKPRRLPLLAALFACSGIALSAPIPVQAQTDGPNASAKAQVHPVSRRVMKDVIGSTVASLEGKEVGKIVDLMVDAHNHQVAYFVIDRDDKRRLIMLPFQLLRVEKDRLSLTVAEEQLKDQRGFSSDEWPDMTDVSWARRLHKDFGVKPYWEMAGARPADDEANNIKDKQQDGPNFSKRDAWVNRASQMVGQPVKSTAGQAMGKVNDLFLDTRQGRGHIVYAILKGMPTDQLKDRMSLVPFSAMQAIPQAKEYRVEAKVEDLAMASLTEADFDRTNDPDWHRRVHSAFQREPYWTTFGIPAEGASDDSVWKPGSAYMKNFDLKRSRRFAGTVVSISDFQAAQGVTGKQVVITSEEDQRKYTFHLGPASLFEGADATFKLEPGDQIVIRGSRGLFNGTELYLADQIAQIKQLRDSSGKELWKDTEPKKQQEEKKKRH